MLHRAVVPHEEIVHLPAMDVPELRIKDPFGEFIDQCKCLILRHALDALALALAQVKALAAGAGPATAVEPGTPW